MDLFPNLKHDLTVTLILALPATLVVLAAGVGPVGRPTSAEAPAGTLDVGLLRQEAAKAPTDALLRRKEIRINVETSGGRKAQASVGSRRPEED